MMMRMPRFATADKVSRDEMLEFVRPRHHCLFVTTRADGRPQLGPVSCGIDPAGRLVIATYPQRAKTVNARRNPAVSACILSDDFNGAYIQLDGHAEVLDMPEALDGFVEYFRSISGEHPDWDEYREAMAKQGKSLLRMTIERWGPIATGGFPPELANLLG
jgi:PPOX class probable F420-dependent enzyme